MILFHGSPTGGQKVLQPTAGHKPRFMSTRPRVWATPDVRQAIIMSRRWTDDDINHGTVDGVHYIKEARPGGLRTLDGPGHVYGDLHPASFQPLIKKGLPRPSEYWSEKPVPVIHLLEVPNVLELLRAIRIRIVPYGGIGSFHPPSEAVQKAIILKNFYPNRVDRAKGVFHGRTSVLLENHRLCYLDFKAPVLQRLFGFDLVGHSLGASQLLGRDEWDQHRGKKKLLIHPYLSMDNGQPNPITRRAMEFGRTNELWILVEEGTPAERLAWDLSINHAVTAKRGGHYPGLRTLVESINFLAGIKRGFKRYTAPVSG